MNTHTMGHSGTRITVANTRPNFVLSPLPSFLNKLPPTGMGLPTGNPAIYILDKNQRRLRHKAAPLRGNGYGDEAPFTIRVD
jgi:hypothetical protein